MTSMRNFFSQMKQQIKNEGEIPEEKDDNKAEEEFFYSCKQIAATFFSLEGTRRLLMEAGNLYHVNSNE